jgi:hypothetical protein
MAEPLIHIGFHKTGTTWLQEQIFNDASLGFARPPLQVIDDAFINVNAFAFDAARARSRFDELFEDARTSSVHPVISHERLSGAPLANGFDARLIADRLVETFPGGNVLIVIREQRDLMLSIYKQYVFVRSGHHTFRRFWGRRVWQASDLPQVGLDVFEYHHLIGYYQKLFGAERVTVLPYEMLRRDPDGFVGRIASTIGTNAPTSVPRERTHASLPSSSLAVLRLLNAVQSALGLSRFFQGRPEKSLLLRGRVKIVGSIGRAAPKAMSSSIDDRWKKLARELTGDRFAESNRITSELTGLDLAAYGYDI